jgi:two-component system, NarL family, vancomycin resistance associated response regulator VraR
LYGERRNFGKFLSQTKEAELIPLIEVLAIHEALHCENDLTYCVHHAMLSCEQKVLRVLVIDDHELTRFSLKLALKNQAGIDLVGIGSNGQEAIDLTQKYSPDVIILDLQMPVMDGLSASTQIKSLYPKTRILAYSSLEDPQTEVMLQTAKIDAFCKKDTAMNDLIAIVNQLGHDSSNSQSDENSSQ